VNLIVLAKAPAPGRSKTRLCPPLSSTEAAEYARAALADTLNAAAMCAADRRVVVLEGQPGEWLPEGFGVIAQRGLGLGERLQAAFDDVGTPALLVGMDTPQAGAGLLDRCLSSLGAPTVDAVLGPAFDGGWWALGVRSGTSGLFDGVPMSTATTGASQLARLSSLRLRTAILPALRDVDRFADAVAVAREAPTTRSAGWIRRWLAGRWMADRAGTVAAR